MDPTISSVVRYDHPKRGSSGVHKRPSTGNPRPFTARQGTSNRRTTRAMRRLQRRHMQARSDITLRSDKSGKARRNTAEGREGEGRRALHLLSPRGRQTCRGKPRQWSVETTPPCRATRTMRRSGHREWIAYILRYDGEVPGVLTALPTGQRATGCVRTSIVMAIRVVAVWPIDGTDQREGGSNGRAGGSKERAPSKSGAA